MHGRTVIYGGSDDLVEVRGDVVEEFTAENDGAETYVGLSDGTLVGIRYGDAGVWVTRTIVPGSGSVTELVEARDHEDTGTMGDDEDGCPAYSQKLVVRSERSVRWVTYGSSMAKASPVPQVSP